MSARPRFVLACFAAAMTQAALGCGPDARGEFAESAFVSPLYGYTIAYEAASYQLAGPAWNVESHSYCGERPCSHKGGSDNVADLALDLDDDDDLIELGEVYRYDVLLEHRNDFGRMWIRTEPMARDLAEKDLDAVAKAIVENIASLHFEGRVDVRSRTVEIRAKRYDTTLHDSRALGIDGQPARIVLFDAEPPDQRPTSGQQRGLRVALVLVRTPYVQAVRTARGVKTFPVLISAGYANSPDAFDASFADFQRLLSRIRLK